MPESEQINKQILRLQQQPRSHKIALKDKLRQTAQHVITELVKEEKKK